MKARATSFLKWLGGILLTLLGFSSCGTTKTLEEDIEWGGPRPIPGVAISMYGVPTSSFKVSGTVRDGAGKTLKGIQVISYYGESTWMRTDTTYTDAAGQFSRTMRTYPADKVGFTFNDIDGRDNGGEFASKSTTVAVKQVGAGDGAWFQGTYEARADVQLEKKR
ncbi:MAG: radical SAM-associated putative lipoprotein [Bacteroidales bacterium]|nr:radical SAM-associated putative lipoprotein [Bacteroidales bacterium]